MAIELPELPFARDALAPHMSRETLDYHYGKHHKKYVDETNKLVAGTPYEKMSLDKIVRNASGKLFNNAAQAWNHDFFWNCLRPAPAAPDARLEKVLTREFGGVEDFKELFTRTAAETFGSGWAWLVKTDGKLKVLSTANAGNPLTKGQKPLLACDVWEHAYYIDYRNERPKYLEHFWNIVNWDFVEANLFGGVGQSREPRPHGAERRPQLHR
jgi:Fe-Mn family superoxide dismutase